MRFLSHNLSHFPQDIDISGLDGEDENSLAKHEEWLRAEAFNAAPDEKMIHHRMNLTAKRRLLEVADMSIGSATRKYPYLMDFERVSWASLLFL